MLFKYIKNISTKVMVLTFSIYLISTLFIVSQAENYEWTVINNSDAIETNSQAEGENNAKAEGKNNVKVENENSESTAQDTLNLDCESAILIEQNSGQVLYEKNAHEQLRPASVTKLMSLLLIFEALENRTNNTRRQSSM